jgi:hypothetical protein
MTAIKLPKIGSRWIAVDNRTMFHVVHVVEVEGHTWVHYEEDNCNECREYSCWVESFLNRFTEITNS